MTHQLKVLIEDAFEIAVGPCVTTPTLRRQLQRMPEVQNVRIALDSQVLSDDDLKSFVDQLMTTFQHGTRFPHDMALAALAVALESRPTPFATEYLSTLARFHLQEMPVSSRIARECLVQQQKEQ